MKVVETTVPRERTFVVEVSDRELQYLSAAVGHLPCSCTRHNSDGELGFGDVANGVFNVLDAAVAAL